jgi:hypothetical protein
MMETRKASGRIRRRCKCLDCGEVYTTSETIISQVDYLLFLEQMKAEGSCVALDLNAESGFAKVTLAFPLPKHKDLASFVEAVTRKWVLHTELSDEEIETEQNEEDEE